MKCRNCGTELPEGAVFCGNCGSRQEKTAAMESNNGFSRPEPGTLEGQRMKPQHENSGSKRVAYAPKPRVKKKNLKAALIAAAALVVAAIAVVIAVSRGTKTEGHDFYAILDAENKCVNILCDGNLTVIPADDLASVSSASIVDTNKDTAIVLLYGYSDEDIDRVFLVDVSGNYQQIFEGEFSQGVLAENSSNFAMIDNDKTMILFDGKKNNKIADDVGNVIISPDGKTLVYETVEDEDGDSELFIYTGGESRKIAENMYPYSVSDKGKYIYAWDTENSRLYVLNAKGDSERLQSDAYILSVNEDRTDIMFVGGDSVYLSSKGGEKEKLISTDGALVYRIDTFTGSETPSKFGGHFYFSYSREELYYLNKDYESEKISGSVSLAYTTEDEKSVYYIKNDSVYVYRLDTQDDEKLITDLGSESFFAVSSDGGEIYYINEDGEYCCFDGKDTDVVEEDGTDIFRINLGEDGTLYYRFDTELYQGSAYVSNMYIGDLYCYQPGGKAKLLASDVYSVTIGKNTVRYATFDGDQYEYFVSTSRNKFKSVLTVQEPDEKPVNFSVSGVYQVEISEETQIDTWTVDSETTLNKYDHDTYRITITNGSGSSMDGWALKLRVGVDYDMSNFIDINKKYSILFDNNNYIDYDFNVVYEGEYLIITPGNYKYADGRFTKDDSVTGSFLSTIDSGTLTLTLIADGISEDTEVLVLGAR